jgi:hypothetical protein
MRARGMGSARGGFGRGASRDDTHIHERRDRDDGFRGSRGRGYARGSRGFNDGFRGGRFVNDRPQQYQNRDEPREYQNESRNENREGG